MALNIQTTITYSYQVQGKGGQGVCMAVQAVLQEHGLCGYTEWASLEWHFVYLTNLEHDALLDSLGDLGKRFQVQAKQNPSPCISRNLLRGKDLSKTSLAGSNLSYADLRQAKLKRVDLTKSDLSMANLFEADLSEANLSHAKLFQTNLGRANLSQAILREANLNEANLSHANLSGADLTRASLDDAILHKANLVTATISNTQLAKAKSLQFAILPDGTQCTEPRFQPFLTLMPLPKDDDLR